MTETPLCGICGRPASLGRLGEVHMHWHCAACFPPLPEAMAQVIWGTPDNTMLETGGSSVAVGTGATIILGAKTARFVAAALDEWLSLTAERLHGLADDEHDPQGWDADDLPMIAGAAGIIRDAEAALHLSHDDHTP